MYSSHCKLILMLIFCITMSNLFGGVIVLIEPPTVVQEFVHVVQEQVKEIIDHENEAQKTKPGHIKYLFDAPQYASHISLAYITDAQLTLKQLLEKQKYNIPALEKIAKETRAIDLTENLKAVEFTCFKGDRDKGNVYKGIPKKNFYYIVLRFPSSPALTHVAQSIQDSLGQFPYFDMHLTIGKLYEDKDRDPQNMVHILKHRLSKQLQIVSADAKKQWVVNSFTLKAHSGSLDFVFSK